MQAARQLLLDHFGDMADKFIEPQDLPKDFLVDFDAHALIESGSAFVNHSILPYAGGWMDQPRWWIEKMQTIYLPGIARAVFERLPADDQKLYHKRIVRKPIPEDGEW